MENNQYILSTQQNIEKTDNDSHLPSNYINVEDHSSIVEALKMKLVLKLVKSHFVIHALHHNTNRIAEGIESNVIDVISLEVDTLSKYLKKCGLILRTTVYAGYTILVKVQIFPFIIIIFFFIIIIIMLLLLLLLLLITLIQMEEAANKSNIKTINPRIPPHICRILLILDHELVYYTVQYTIFLLHVKML